MFLVLNIALNLYMFFLYLHDIFSPILFLLFQTWFQFKNYRFVITKPLVFLFALILKLFERLLESSDLVLMSQLRFAKLINGFFIVILSCDETLDQFVFILDSLRQFDDLVWYKLFLEQLLDFPVLFIFGLLQLGNFCDVLLNGLFKYSLHPNLFFL